MQRTSQGRGAHSGRSFAMLDVHRNERNESMSLFAFAAPIPPEKKEQWDHFMEELTGPRRADFVAASERAGVRERTFFQETPDGMQMVIITLEGDEPETAKMRAANEDTDFARWFVQQVQEIH